MYFKILNYFLLMYLFLIELSLFCLRAFSSCSKRGLLPSGSVKASPCGGFASCSSRALESRLSSCGT